MDRQNITIDFKDTQLVGDIVPPDSVPQALFLHGAGQSNRLRYDYLRQPLVADEIASCAFDFIGHGETGGNLQNSSLRERTDQASTVIDTLSLPEPFGIVAGSMSAYTALRLTQLYDIDRLVLIVPAVYPEDAYDLPFSEDFSRKIREKDGWSQSDAWEILESYAGKLLILAAGNDEKIPQEVPQRIYDSAVHAESRVLHVVKKAPHQIREFLLDPQNDAEFKKCYSLIMDTLS